MAIAFLYLRSSTSEKCLLVAQGTTVEISPPMFIAILKKDREIPLQH